LLAKLKTLKLIKPMLLTFLLLQMEMMPSQRVIVLLVIKPYLLKRLSSVKSLQNNNLRKFSMTLTESMTQIRMGLLNSDEFDNLTRDLLTNFAPN